MSTDLAIDLKNVAKVYKGRVHALQGIEMHVRKGEIFGLLGPNGAGKSTLVKIMMTVLRPTRAEGTVLGAPIGDKPTLARVGYLPENHRFPKYLTGRQTLEFFGAMSKVDRATARRRASELLETVRMQDWAGTRIATYSKGMLQRIGLAQSLMCNPDLVLLDEPTDGVDPVGRREILDVMGRLRDQGKTVFINSHALSELESISDRVAILVKGQVARQGTIDELTVAKQRYEIEFVWTDPAKVREAVLASVPAAGWKSAAPSVTTAQPPPMPMGSAPPPPPLAGGAVPLAYASRTEFTGRLVPRVVDRGTLPDGKWIELDGPILRIGSTDPADVQSLLDGARQRGLIVRRVQQMRVSLEDLFIEAVTDPVSGKSMTPGAGPKMFVQQGGVK
jgi:ABC-2 type transport system ATP-binding protein